MEIGRVELPDRHALQRDRVTGSVGDDRVMTRIDRSRRRQNIGYAGEQSVADVDRVLARIEIGNGRTSKARLEKERILTAITKNRDIATDVVERVVPCRSIDC